MKPKKILFVDLSLKTYEMRLLPELYPYVGGVTLGVKLYSLYRDYDPLILSIGPLNGFFPFISKLCLIVKKDGMIEDLYLGGSISYRLAFSGLDAVVLVGSSPNEVVLDIINDQVKFLEADVDFGSLGLPGKRSLLLMDKGGLVLDGYFAPSTTMLEEKFSAIRLLGLCLTGTEVYPVKDSSRYNALYKEILDNIELMDEVSSDNPSCSGCPLGCDDSQNGEIGGNILLHSLVSCCYAENIYSNFGTVFACLDCLGYKYTHEELESLPDLFSKTMKEIA